MDKNKLYLLTEVKHFLLKTLKNADCTVRPKNKAIPMSRRFIFESFNSLMCPRRRQTLELGGFTHFWANQEVKAFKFKQEALTLDLKGQPFWGTLYELSSGVIRRHGNQFQNNEKPMKNSAHSYGSCCNQCKLLCMHVLSTPI